MAVLYDSEKLEYSGFEFFGMKTFSVIWAVAPLFDGFDMLPSHHSWSALANHYAVSLSDVKD